MVAINRPITQTMISTTAWGIPITDAVNALMVPHVIAGKQSNISQTGLGAGVWSTVSGMSVTFTAKANWLYEIGWGANVNSSVAGLWYNAGLQVNGAAPYRFSSSFTGSTTAPTYGNLATGSQFCSAKLGGVLPAGSYTLVLQTTATGGTYNIDPGAGCYIYVADWGSDT